MKRLIFFLLFFPPALWSQTDSATQVAFFKETITYLASDSLKGRDPASIEINLALQFVRNTLKQAGLKPFNHRFMYTHEGKTFQANNCYVFLDNQKANTVLIGAHYDHIGLGGTLSKSHRSDAIHNGADDNASGVALALALARSAELKNLDVNLLFVFYSAHEVGLYGSHAFADPFLRKKKRFQRISTIVNFDMIGRMNHSRELFVSSNVPLAFPTSDLLKVVEGDAAALSQLDTAPYLTLGVPVYNFTTGLHSDYHKISDDARFINYPGMEYTFRFLMQWLTALH